MSVEEFKQSTAGLPPEGLSRALVALWHDERGDWAAAHESAQSEEAGDGAWVHAYLHRREGDLGNAAYWYRRAGRPVPACCLEDEWDQIARELLAADELRGRKP
jgi:hypothetical protein